MKSWKSLTAITLAAALAAGLVWWSQSKKSVQETGLVREATPTKILEHVRELRAPLVLVNFWASWCEPCKVEFPHLLTLRKAYGRQGLQVVFVSVDDSGDLSAAESFLKANQVDFVSFYKGSQSLKFVSEIFPSWTGAVPATVLFGADGNIVDSWEGDTSLEEFEAKIKPHLKGS